MKISHCNTETNFVPTGLGNFTSLRQFDLHDNMRLKGGFQYVDACYRNELSILPKDLALCHNFKVLKLSYSCFNSIPKEYASLRNEKKMDPYLKLFTSSLPTLIGYSYRKLNNLKLLGCVSLTKIPESILAYLNACAECRKLRPIYDELAPMIDEIGSGKAVATVPSVRCQKITV